MRKSLITLLAAVLLFGTILVSCSNDVAVQDNELVSVSFADSSRTITAKLVDFNAAEYYWYYAAKKNVLDTSGLVSGQTDNYDETGAVAVSSEKGLDGRVNGFSQGLWDFKLFAYAEANKTNLTYSGEATGVLLEKGETNNVNVTVSPQKGTDNGTLVVNDITFNPASISSAPDLEKSIVVTPFTGNSEVPDPTIDSNVYTYSLAPGAYKVTVSYTKTVGDKKITYASGTVIATVYSNLTTTVSGDVSELVTDAGFGAAQNADAVNVSAKATEIQYDNNADSVNPVTLEDEDGKVTATVSKSDTNTIISTLAANAGVSATDTTTSLSLELKVNTTAITATSVTYEIGMEATLTYKDSNDKDQSVKSDVSSLDNYVTATIQMQTGLLDVAVTHDGVAMNKCATKDTLDAANTDSAGYYFYDSENGELYIKTKSFSPFAVSYRVQKEVACIGTTTYESLAEAVENAKDGETITLLCDFSLEPTSQDKPNAVTISKAITLDGNGYTITMSGSGQAKWQPGDCKDESGLYVTGSSTVRNLKIKSSNLAHAICFDGNIEGKLEKVDVSTEGGNSVDARGNSTVSMKDCNITVTYNGSGLKYHLISGVHVLDASVTIEKTTINAFTEVGHKTNEENYKTWCKAVYLDKAKDFDSSATRGAKVILVDGNLISGDVALGVDGFTGTKNDDYKNDETRNVITVEGGTYKGLLTSPNGGSYKSLEIKGGTFNNFKITSLDTDGNDNDEGRKITQIFGGTFDADPTKYVVSKYGVVRSGESEADYIYSVVAKSNSIKETDDEISIDLKTASQNDLDIFFGADGVWNSGMTAGSDGATVIKNGAWFAYKDTDFNQYKYKLVYAVDTSSFGDDDQIVFDCGLYYLEPEIWNSKQITAKKDSTEFIITTEFQKQDDYILCNYTVTGGSNYNFSNEIQLKQQYNNTNFNLYWDVYGPNIIKNAKLTSFSFVREALNNE